MVVSLIFMAFLSIVNGSLKLHSFYFTGLILNSVIYKNRYSKSLYKKIYDDPTAILTILCLPIYIPAVIPILVDSVLYFTTVLLTLYYYLSFGLSTSISNTMQNILALLCRRIQPNNFIFYSYLR